MTKKEVIYKAEADLEKVGAAGAHYAAAEAAAEVAAHYAISKAAACQKAFSDWVKAYGDLLKAKADLQKALAGEITKEEK